MSTLADTGIPTNSYIDNVSQLQKQSSYDQSTPVSSNSSRKRTRSRSVEDDSISNMDGAGFNTSNSPWRGWAELENDPVGLLFSPVCRTDDSIAHLHSVTERLGCFKRECRGSHSIGRDLREAVVSTIRSFGRHPHDCA